MSISNAEKVKEAKKILRNTAKEVPPIYSYILSERFLGNIHIKIETPKTRGITYKLLKLKNEGKRGIIYCDSECIKCISHLEPELLSRLTIIIPNGVTPPTPLEGIKLLKGKKGHKEDIESAMEISKKEGLEYIDFYEDMDIIYGYGTVALEFLRDEKSLEMIIVPVRHGRLLSGIGIFTKEILPQVKVIGAYRKKNLNKVTSYLIERYTDGIYPVSEGAIEEAKMLYIKEFKKEPKEEILSLSLLIEGKVPTKNKSIGLIL